MGSGLTSAESQITLTKIIPRQKNKTNFLHRSPDMFPGIRDDIWNTQGLDYEEISGACLTSNFQQHDFRRGWTTPSVPPELERNLAEQSQAGGQIWLKDDDVWLDVEMCNTNQCIFVFSTNNMHVCWNWTCPAFSITAKQQVSEIYLNPGANLHLRGLFFWLPFLQNTAKGKLLLF